MTTEAAPIEARPRTEARSSWFPWRRPGHHGHPALADAHDDRTLGERVADSVASFGGSWPFIFAFLGMMAAWMVLNTVVIQRLVHGHAFDPYPYIALNLCLSALAGLQAPIIMMSQNRAAAKDEILAAHHYDETHKIEDLVRSNTVLTEQVHELAERIRELAEQHAANHSSGP